MKKVVVSAPGKLMLFGEHAVIYSEPCIVTAVSSRLKVSIENRGTGIFIDSPQTKDTRFVEAAIKLLTSNYKLPTKNDLHIKTSCDFSGKYGFGSSSAVTVATIYALGKFYKLSLSKRDIFNLAYQVIQKVQGTGSGFDVAAASFGGTLFYKNGGEIIAPLPLKFNNTAFVIGYSGVKSNTVELIKQVREKRDKNPKKYDRIFASIGKLVMQAREALLAGNWKLVGSLMDVNQNYLRDLGVSTDRLEKLISKAKRGGALGAKLSGAGGGDCMIAIVELNKRKRVEDAISNAGGEVVPVDINEEGVK